VLVYSAIRVLEPLSEELFIITRNFLEDIVFNPRVHIIEEEIDHIGEQIKDLFVKGGIR